MQPLFRSELLYTLYSLNLTSSLWERLDEATKKIFLAIIYSINIIKPNVFNMYQCVLCFTIAK